MDGNERLSDVGSKYGAPMGRPNVADDHAATVKLFRVRFVDGCYDSGGAYWGAGEPLYAAIGDGFEWYARARSLEDARSDLLDEFPELTIELPEVDPDFLTGYLTAALWSSTDDEGYPLDDRCDTDDISPELLAESVADCRGFLELAGEILSQEPERLNGCSRAEYAGHDFWLTRNHHGAGFWDGNWTEGNRLTEISHTFGSVDLYVGDDGRVYG